MGTPLQIRFLGSLYLERDQALRLPRWGAVCSLLSFLVVHHDESISRERLAGLFWPDQTEPRARRALSNALWQIRRTLGEAAGRLVSEREMVTWHFLPGDWFDVDEFQSLCEQAQAAPLRQAVDLYKGDLLPDIYDDWALLERERLRELYLRSLGRLLTTYKQGNDYEQALVCAQRLVAADPLRESGHRELMRLYHLVGRSQAALEQYAILREHLAEELGIVPSPATAALYHKIAAALKDPAAAHLPVAPPPPPLLRDLSCLPFVGRVSERATLLDALQTAIQGHGSLALVEGDAGVGKTRLVRQVMADAEWRGFQVGLGKADALAGLAPYQLLLDALLPLLTPLRAAQLAELVEPLWLSVVAHLLPPIARHLPDLPSPPPLAPLEQQRRLGEGLAHCVSGLARVAPCLLVLDDVQWADEATLAILPSLASHISGDRLVLILAYRTAEARERPAVWQTLQALDRALPLLRLRLLPFERTEAVALVQRALDASSADTQTVALAASLQDETGGNALFLVETLRSLVEQKILDRAPDGEWIFPRGGVSMPTPASVRELVLGRLARLPASLQTVLEWVAVLGEEADFPVLSLACGVDLQVLLPALEELNRRGFLAETPTCYRFEHDCIREIVYQAIARERQHKLHQRAGAVMEELRPGRVEALAYHFSQGEVWKQAADYGQQAGDRARLAYANQEAVTHYTRVLEAFDRQPGPGTPARRFEILLAREAVNDLRGEREAQSRDLALLATLALELDDDQRRAAVALRWAEYYERMSDYPAAIEAAQQAVEYIGQVGNVAMEARCHVAWGRALWRQGNYAPAQERYKHALTLAQTGGDRWGEAECLYNLGIIDYEVGEHLSAGEHYRRALSIRRALGDRKGEADILNHLGGFYRSMGDHLATQECQEQALAIKRAIGDRLGEARTLYSLSIYYHNVGKGDIAQQYCEEALSIAQALGERQLEAFTLTYLGLILERPHASELPSKADLCTAQSYYARAVDIRRQIGQLGLTMDSLAGLARVALAQGELAQAARGVDEILAWIGQHGTETVGDIILVYLTAYRVLLAAGQGQRAQAALTDGYNLLMEAASEFPDEETRRSMLENVWPFRELVAVYRTGQAGTRARQIHLRLPRADAPTGRPLRDEEWVDVTWTIHSPEDDGVPKTARRQRRLLRLVREAGTQNAAPTIDDLAEALEASRATVKRDLAALRGRGEQIKTRGGRGEV